MIKVIDKRGFKKQSLVAEYYLARVPEPLDEARDVSGNVERRMSDKTKFNVTKAQTRFRCLPLHTRYIINWESADYEIDTRGFLVAIGEWH